MSRCQKCKPGWECSRGAGHPGPCAAWPTNINEYPTDEDTDLTIESLFLARQLIEGHISVNQDADNAMLRLALDWINKGILNHRADTKSFDPSPSLLQRIQECINFPKKPWTH